MSRDDLDLDLERLRARTEGLAPDERFSDAIMEAAKAAAPADPLAAIARATEGLDAAPEIADAIVERAQTQAAPKRSASRRAPSWMEGVTRSGPVAVGLALVAAAASVLFFVSSERDADATVVSTVDAVEVFE